MLATPNSLVELDKNLHLKTCISLESESFEFHRLSLAEYPLYSGFAVLTLLQVVSVVTDIGRLSQTPRRSKPLSEDHVPGQGCVSHHYCIVMHRVDLR